MTPDVKPLVAGNWKMNGLRASLDQIKAMAEGVKGDLSDKVETLICPPATLLYVATALCDDSPLLIGAQDCHEKVSGAHTGDVSAEMIADCFGTHVIVGHSERRTDHKETIVKDFWAEPSYASLLQASQKRFHNYVVAGQGTAKEALDGLAADWKAIFEDEDKY